MTKLEATQAIHNIDKQIDSLRRKKDGTFEERLFELRGWYQRVRDTAGDRWAKTHFANAVTTATELQRTLAHEMPSLR